MSEGLGILFMAVALVFAGFAGYGFGKDQAQAADLSKEEAFRFGYQLAVCNDGELFRPLANMTVQCQGYIMAFCREHPETYAKEDCDEAGVLA